MRKQCLRASNRGFTLLELLVASSLGLLVVGMSLTTLTSERRIYKHDIVKTRVNQNLRSAIDIIGMNVRQAGEALPDYFPAIQLSVDVNGASELTIRRNLYENEVFNLCQNVAQGAITPSFRVAYSTTLTGCIYGTAYASFLTTWQSYRTSQGGSVPVYIYDRSNKRGEYLTFTGGNNSSSQITLNRNNAPWTYAYTGNGQTVALYILEEYKFRLHNGILQLLKNGDTTTPLNIIDNVTNFNVDLHMMDGSIKSTFNTSDTWTELRRINVNLKGSDSFAGDAMKSEVTVQLFPRNILSH